MDILVLTDNEYLYEEFEKIINGRPEKFTFFYSYNNKTFKKKYATFSNISPIDLKREDEDFWNRFDLFISLHCKQLFPDELVRKHRCINIHPGFNPYNRGWFPQVFSIINKKKIGVTIHEMDTELDHGPIIFQYDIPLFMWETSYDVYSRLLQLELKMLKDHLGEIISGSYSTQIMSDEGNINYKSDFDSLCKLDLNSYGTLGEHIDLLRALTFKGYENAHIIDEDGSKIYVSIELKKCISDVE